MVEISDDLLKQKMDLIHPDHFGSDSLKLTAKKLLDSLEPMNAIGLASNQCGIGYRMFVMRTQGREFVCCNPEIVASSDGTQINREGCISFPLLYISIRRFNSIHAVWYDENGKKFEEDLMGEAARCFQHELDHLNGITFDTRAGPFALELAMKKKNKLEKELYK